MEHVFRRVHDLGKFEIIIESRRYPGPRYKVQVTNEGTVTYFSGPGWVRLVREYEWEAGENIVFILMYVDRVTYFDFEDDDRFQDAEEN